MLNIPHRRVAAGLLLCGLSLAGVAAGLLLRGLSMAGVASASDYWMYVGSYTSRGGKGIYVFKFHAATGKVEPAGLAAGSLWEANNDSLKGGLARMLAQLRAGWPSPKAIVRGVQNPLSIAVHPNQHYLYTADSNESGTVSAFRIDPASGKLTILNERSSAGKNPGYITVDRTGKNVLVANFDGATVAVLPLRGDGYLQAASSVVQHKGLGPDRYICPHPHSIHVSPDNRFAIATDLSLDEVLVYRFNADKGTLTPHNPPFVKTPRGSGARHFSFNPNGRFGYVIEEAGSSVMAMGWDAEHGVFTTNQAVSTLPADFHGESAAADVIVHPSGRFLYGSNRGHDSIAVLAIAADKGTLTPLEYVSTQGGRPRTLCFDPTGQYLFAANVEGQNVVQFRIDQTTGRLVPTGVTLQVPYPSAVAFAPAN